MHAVILVNLGTPEAPTPRAVKAFLSEFLHDHRVIKLTRWLWCPILHWLILPRRSPKVAQLYQSIWMQQGSPIKVITRQQVRALQKALGEAYEVKMAMRYGSPNLKMVLEGLDENRYESVTIVPMYPQFSHTTTSSVLDIVNAVKARKRLNALRTVEPYYDNPLYIQALAESVQSYWNEYGRGEKLLMSFHGIPEKYVKDGDPYPEHCQRTAELLAEALHLQADEYQLSYQSRFGPTAWVKPYTDETLQAYAKSGIKRVDVISPAFAADCLETLEELAHTNKQLFIEAGGEQYHYIPALNVSEQHIEMLKQLTESRKSVSEHSAQARWAR